MEIPETALEDISQSDQIPDSPLMTHPQAPSTPIVPAEIAEFCISDKVINLVLDYRAVPKKESFFKLYNIEEFSEAIKTIYSGKVKLVTVLKELDEVLKVARESADIVRRTGHNMKYLRDGFFDGSLVDTDKFDKELNALLENTAKPLTNKDGKLAASVRTLAGFMLDKAITDKISAGNLTSPKGIPGKRRSVIGEKHEKTTKSMRVVPTSGLENLKPTVGVIEKTTGPGRMDSQTSLKGGEPENLPMFSEKKILEEDQSQEVDGLDEMPIQAQKRKESNLSRSNSPKNIPQAHKLTQTENIPQAPKLTQTEKPQEDKPPKEKLVLRLMEPLVIAYVPRHTIKNFS